MLYLYLQFVLSRSLRGEQGLKIGMFREEGRRRGMSARARVHDDSQRKEGNGEMSSHPIRVCRFAWRRLRGDGEGSIKMMTVLGKEGRVGQVVVPACAPFSL